MDTPLNPLVHYQFPKKIVVFLSNLAAKTSIFQIHSVPGTPGIPGIPRDPTWAKTSEMAVAAGVVC